MCASQIDFLTVESYVAQGRIEPIGRRLFYLEAEGSQTLSFKLGVELNSEKNLGKIIIIILLVFNLRGRSLGCASFERRFPSGDLS